MVFVQVVGIPHERLGEEVGACITVKDGAAEITLKDLVTFCKGKMAGFKIPSQLRIVGEFPKTVSGKIQKFKLLEEFK